MGALAPPYVTLPRKRGSHKPVFSCNSIGAPSNCKREFVGAVGVALDGATVVTADAFVANVLSTEVVGAIDCVAFTSGAGALAAEVVGATVAAVDVAAGLATVGLTAVAPAVALLCAKTIELAHNGKATTTPNAHPKVGLFIAADLTSVAMRFIIKG